MKLANCLFSQFVVSTVLAILAFSVLHKTDKNERKRLTWVPLIGTSGANNARDIWTPLFTSFLLSNTNIKIFVAKTLPGAICPEVLRESLKTRKHNSCPTENRTGSGEIALRSLTSPEYVREFVKGKKLPQSPTLVYPAKNSLTPSNGSSGVGLLSDIGSLLVARNSQSVELPKAKEREKRLLKLDTSTEIVYTKIACTVGWFL